MARGGASKYGRIKRVPERFGPSSSGSSLRNATERAFARANGYYYAGGCNASLPGVCVCALVRARARSYG